MIANLDWFTFTTFHLETALAPKFFFSLKWIPLLANQASVLHEPSQKGSGSIPDLTSHVYKELMRCKSACGVKSGIDPLPFWLGGEQKMLGFSHVLRSIKGKDLLKEGKNDRKAFRTGAKIHCSEKNILGLGHFKYLRSTAIILPIPTQTSRPCRQITVSVWSTTLHWQKYHFREHEVSRYVLRSLFTCIQKIEP